MNTSHTNYNTKFSLCKMDDLLYKMDSKSNLENGRESGHWHLQIGKIWSLSVVIKKYRQKTDSEIIE